ncbi:zinc transport system substrate-binding protein [Arcanobacterium pluranimalium]|uniref:metal ABC transporter substrate-binding protein n=1 Tax=Arcanobacterium pluranimalium TaxID=108028 RepID=UPI00195CB167|nr:metal ABC transporter substrate-binding protein [Arcanobacterium pluranimalium]MBM7825578.1 zinc transport system substrate-binding protein [Arcanobacterium pluranimalium]
MKEKLSLKFAAIFGAAALALAGCSGSSETSKDSTKLNVSTSFYPITYLVEKIGGDAVKVNDLTPPGSDAHGAELSPAEISAMEKSDLVIYLATMSPSIDEAIKTAKIKKSVEIGQSVSLLPRTEIAAVSEQLPNVDPKAKVDNHDHEAGHDDHDADHKDEHKDDAKGHDDNDHEAGHDDHDGEGHDEHGHDEHGHDHGVNDPHFWTDPSRLAKAAPVIADELAKLDSKNANKFKDNAKKIADELNKLAADFKATLAKEQCRTRSFVVTHLAFGYLAKENNLKQIGIASFDPDLEPSPARIAQIKEIVARDHVNTIFTTSDQEMKTANSVANETGAKVQVLDPAATKRDKNKDYMDVMKQNFKLLSDSMSCK